MSASVSAGSLRQAITLHHSPSDSFSRSQQVDVIADLVEREHLLARNPPELRDVDAVPDQSHVSVVAADRQQAESELQSRARAQSTLA